MCFVRFSKRKPLEIMISAKSRKKISFPFLSLSYPPQKQFGRRVEWSGGRVEVRKAKSEWKLELRGHMHRQTVLVFAFCLSVGKGVKVSNIHK